MNEHSPALALAAVVALATTAGAVLAQGKIDPGRQEFESNCVVCHGLKGKGDGPYVAFVAERQGAKDITTLAKRNGGVFPTQRVYEIIDGRHAVQAHGPRDMPIWGRDYLIRAGEYYHEVPYDPEAYVRFRITALTDYVDRLQVK